MLQRGTPWQAALGLALFLVISFSATMLMSILSGWLGWYSFFTGIFLAAGFLFIIILIPILLNLSRSFFWIVFILVIIHITITLLAFALHYMNTGLQGVNGHFNPSFYEALYFSATTFTTLGYGDIQPLPNYRLTTSIQALSGMVSMAIGASLMWLWTQENLVPKEMAFFDGNRRRKGDISITRIRIRTFTGKDLKLEKWAFPAKEGEAYRYDEEREEWVLEENNSTTPKENSPPQSAP